MSRALDDPVDFHKRTERKVDQNPHILVAGAGIGGLALALALLRKGIDATVFEQAPELKPLGAGLQISPNGTRVLQDLEMSQALEGSYCETGSREVRLWNTGQTWPLFDLGADCVARFGAPYWTIHRGDLHMALLAEVERTKAGCVHLGRSAQAFQQTADGVEVTFQDGSKATGSALVGADGVHSAIRSALGIQDKPEFTGMMAWRGITPTEDLPEELRRNVGANWIGPGRHFVTYPMRGGKYINLVGIVEGADWIAESWNMQGETADWHADFDGWHPLLHTLIERVETPYKWAFVGREPIEKWSSGVVTLLGDAAHPTLPFLGQGACMALEDSAVLARCIEGHIGDLARAMTIFEGLRVDRTSKIVRNSREMATRFHNPSLADPDDAIAFINREWTPEKTRTRYDWLYEYDYFNVPIGL